MSSKTSLLPLIDPACRRIALTGGIGSGKSYVCRQLELMGYPVFYCDAEARRIIGDDPSVRDALTRLVGAGVYAGGALCKPVLRDYLCTGPDHAARVDAIVHPRVGQAFEWWAARQESARVFMECALLFEAGFDRYVDATVLVTAPLELRLARVMRRDALSRKRVLAMMALQMSEEEKARRAGYQICNDGQADVGAQLRALLGA